MSNEPGEITLMEKLQRRLLAKKRERAAEPKTADHEETADEREARLMDDPDAWTTVSAGNRGSILPR